MEQLIWHLVGDYLTQSDWMALNKTKRAWPAIVHGTIYALPFLVLCRHAPHPLWALLAIWATHILIDRFRLARYVVWAKNWLGAWRLETMDEALRRARAEDRVFQGTQNPRKVPPNLPWHECAATGYSPLRPDWLTVWLLIVTDNTMHLAINYASLRWL